MDKTRFLLRDERIRKNLKAFIELFKNEPDKE